MLSSPIDLQQVRQLFSDPQRSAGTDFLRREIAGRMREKLELVKIQPACVLDAGCGAGADLPELQRSYPEALVIGLDASPAMLRSGEQARGSARQVLGRFLSRLTPAALRAEPAPALISGDFADLPLAPRSVDLIWSNLALHWHPQPHALFAEWRRVLRTEGLLMFSCFGPDTLTEVRAAFAEADPFPHTLQFVDMHDFGDMLIENGFSTPVMDMEKLTLTYEHPQALLEDVRALGGNPLENRLRGLTGRSRYQRLLEALEKQRQPDGRLHLTIEVVYGHAFKPVPAKTESGEAIIRFDLPRRQR
ncbi:methyltransferase domain-containing protein [Undibacterium luofuense]|uniref:Malonyl-[acyl-carrier protein] O-methyltransferase n=1 Tax=Undibacterium luofuense TaxID=2828733 RepID=A0A941DLG4_9BURK|nr:methyltransferase domain-containing protein [Undibacterium luofuense]MBR7782145.1 methyltransferase domain-containing protein [Undibacterium luofuense]